ncbi:MAG TPA: Holliday junction resolvase RuvX [Pyrinomonadaceae bacterium]|nr:Holliday junction resolvase RuvX [Pyrinomonadaceae bacterium]
MSRRALWFTQLEEPRKITASSPAPLDSPGRLLALDLGAKRIGVAVSDELRITVRPLPIIWRRSWKDLLRQVAGLVESLEAKGLVIGLPLRLDGAENSAAESVRTLAEKFRRSLGVPIYLQDERLTTFAANSDLKSAGLDQGEIKREVDSEAAAIILRDFINRMQS